MSASTNGPMAAVLKKWREAATLLLVTSSSNRLGLNLTSEKQDAAMSRTRGINVGNTGENIDVLLLKRSHKSKFMPNLYVFPGGVADNSDFSPKWIDIFSKLGKQSQEDLFSRLTNNLKDAPPMISRHRDSRFSSIPADIAFRICAIRETFEECGILLARPTRTAASCFQAQYVNSGFLTSSIQGEDDQKIFRWRGKTIRDPENFLKMCEELDFIPEIWALHEWSNWLTPTRAEENRRRFDTIFYICCLDHKPLAVEDNKEMIYVKFMSVSSILKEFYAKQTGIAPPQLYELAKLLNFSTASELKQFACEREFHRVERFLPVAMETTDHVVVPLPGDDLYPKDPEKASKELFSYNCSLAELNDKYPKQHRTVARKDDRGIFSTFIQSNISSPRGQVLPNLEVLEKLKEEALTKPKL